jgi:Tol biopolymer transport system component
MLMPLAGGPSRELMKLNEFVYLGGWTPDGQSLLLSRPLSRDNSATAKWILPINGGPPRELDLDENFATQLQVHPDGKRIAFWSNNQTGEQIWVLENYLPSTKDSK